MVRELARKNKQLPQEDCITLLQNERRGILLSTGTTATPMACP